VIVVYVVIDVMPILAEVDEVLGVLLLEDDDDE
jgi:hypothetical protein